jgi:ketosteroid isomerase-like protein
MLLLALLAPLFYPNAGAVIMRLPAILGVVLLVAACAAESETPAVATAAAEPLSPAALDSVKAVDAAFAAGMNAKDTAAVFAIYAADAKVMPPDSPTLEGPAGHPPITGLMAAGATDFVLTPTTTYGIGDLAYSVGIASFKIGGASETVKYAEVMRRGDDGKWRYVVDMFSGIAPPAAMAPAKKK